MYVWKNRAGQSREETKESDRFTSKDQSSCSSKPEVEEEGKTRLADNWLGILVLTSCLQSPKWFECCLPRRLLLPLMLLQQSQAFQAFSATKPRLSRRMMISVCFQRLERVWLLLWAVSHQCCIPRDPMTCQKSHYFPLGYVARETCEQKFVKEGAVHFLLLLLTPHLLFNQLLIAVFSLWYVTWVNGCAWEQLNFGRFCCSECGERLGAGMLQHSISTKAELLHKRDKYFP